MAAARVVLAVALLAATTTTASTATSPTTTASTASYDPADAFRLAMFSYSAYCPVPSLQTWTCPHCAAASTAFAVEGFATSEKLDLRAFVGFDNATQRVIVAFRGSLVTVKDIIDDLKAAHHTKYTYGGSDTFVSWGFWQAELALEDQLDALVGRSLLAHGANTTRVVVTGHSLGAAMAVLYATHLVETQRLPATRVALTTFGTPRVGSPSFARYQRTLGLPQFRVVNDHDPIVHLPPKILIWHHTSREVWYTGSNFKVCDGSGEDPTCSDSVKMTQWENKEHNSYFDVEKKCP